MNLWVLTALLLAYSGMLSLCLGLERHYRQLWQRPTATWLRPLLRGAGWLLLIASFACCVSAWGWAMAAPGWLGLLSLSGLALVMLLPYARRLPVWMALLGWPVLGLASLL